MKYKNKSEFIVQGVAEDGVVNSVMIHHETKNEIFSPAIGAIKSHKENHESGLIIDSDVIKNTVLTRSPITCNTIQGLQKSSDHDRPLEVLFVGYYDQGRQLNWLMDNHSETNIVYNSDGIPYDSREISQIVKYEIAAQFHPVIADQYPYNMNVTVAEPPESRHQGAIHDVYDRFNITKLTCNKQFKFGSTSWTLTETPARQFDVVVFTYVPKKYDDTTFDTSYVAERLGSAIRPDTILLDVNIQGEDDELRFSNRENKLDISPQIVKAFSTRAEWDEDVITGRSTHFKWVSKGISAYQI
tara:strand:+ start:1571 stop:2470 length:900 start_codon:yes stop_codon:yes gene_type:complete